MQDRTVDGQPGNHCRLGASNAKPDARASTTPASPTCAPTTRGDDSRTTTPRCTFTQLLLDEALQLSLTKESLIGFLKPYFNPDPQLNDGRHRLRSGSQQVKLSSNIKTDGCILVLKDENENQHCIVEFYGYPSY